MKPSITIQIEENPSPEELEQVGSGLSGFNETLVGPNELQLLTVFVRDENGAVVGGLAGYTAWKWLYVRLLWVSDALRHQGYGSALLEAAEQEAVRRGCTGAHLDTFSFQAPDFYQKQGYVIFGEIPNFPPGHTRYFLKKEL